MNARRWPVKVALALVIAAGLLTIPGAYHAAVTPGPVQHWLHQHAPR